MRLARFSMIALAAGGALAFASAPAFALGHKGDPRHITALREGSSGAPPAAAPRSDGVPEIEAGALVGAAALVAGGLSILHVGKRFRGLRRTKASFHGSEDA